MTDKSLEMLKWLLEDLETDEGVCYKTRSSTCATACPLWYAGAFGDNICLPSVLGHRVTRMIRDKRLREREKRRNGTWQRLRTSVPASRAA